MRRRVRSVDCETRTALDSWSANESLVPSYVPRSTGVILTQAMGPELSGEITPHAGPQCPEVSVAYIRYVSP